MAKLVGNRLPRPVLDALDGNELDAKFGQTFLVLTTDSDGTPRPCMLSAGEMLALGPETIRLALWPGSRTGANLARGGRVVVCYVAVDIVLYIRGRSRSLGAWKNPEIERFEIVVNSVESDMHEGLPVVHGIEFTADSSLRRQTIEAWQHVLQALRAVDGVTL
jgi:flavin reductase (DIM6/NTAB) family NADH-FMN oxidoreductase RutF